MHYQKIKFFRGDVMVKIDDKTADVVVCELLDTAESLDVKPGMLMCDRGFFSTDVIHALNNRIIEREKDKSAPPFNYMIQGVRTKYVADALNEYATKNRDAVSEGIITGGTQGSNGGKSEAKYWMCITKSTAYDSKKRREEEKAKKNKGRT